MKSLDSIFGSSPFEHVVDHVRKVHECVALIRPIADAILSGDTGLLRTLQDRMSQAEYEADQLKDHARQTLPRRLYLPVQRDDMLNFIRQVDRMADDAEDFAVVATLRRLTIPAPLQPPFLALVDKVVQLSECLLDVADDLNRLQKEAFEGREAEAVLEKIKLVCHMEWESDKLSRQLARHYYADENMDAVTILLFDKICKALTGIADHAENVGKNLRLMILRK